MSDDPIVDLAVAAAPTAEPAPKDDFVADLYSTHVADPSAISLSDLSSFGQYMGTGPESPDSLLGGIFDAFARGTRRVQTGFADTFAEWGNKNAAEYSDGLKSMMAFNQERYGWRGANWFERGLEDITFMAPTMLGTAALVALTPGVPDEAAGVAAIAKSWNAAKAMRLSQALTPLVIGTQTYGTRVQELRAMTGGRVSENDIAGMAAWGAYGIDGLLESIIPGEQIAGAVLGRAGSSVLGKWLKTATGREASKDLGRSIFGYPFVGGLKSLTMTLPAELLEEGVQGNADSLLKNYAMGERMDFGDAFARGLSDMYDAFPSVAMMSVMGAGLHAGKAEIQRKEVMDGVTGNDAPTPVQQSKIEALYGNDDTLKGRDAAMTTALTELFGEQGTPDAKHAAVTLTQISRNLALQDRKAGNESAMPWDYVQGLSLSYLELSPSQRSTLKDLQNSGASNDQIYGFFAESSPTFAANVQSVHDRIDAIETEKANKGLRDDLTKALGIPEAQIDRTHRTLDIPLVSSKVEAEAKAEGIDLTANAVHMLSNVGVKRAIGNLEIAKTIMAKPLRLEIGGKGYTLKLNDDFSGLLIPETKTKKAKTATKVGDIDASQIAQGIQDAAQEARSALQAKVTARLGPVLGQGQIGAPTASQTLVGKERATIAEAAANVPEGVKTPRNRLADAVAEQIYLNRRLSRVASMGTAWAGIQGNRPIITPAPTQSAPKLLKAANIEAVPQVEGTEFNGVQKIPGEPDQHVYTDTQTKSTFYVPADATVEQVTAKRDEMRKKFEGTPPLAQEVTPEQDARYLKAVESGDEETAQRMADEAAKNAGYTIPAFHGTSGPDFTVFDTSRGGYMTGAESAQKGIFTTSNKDVADSYSKNIGMPGMFRMALGQESDPVMQRVLKSPEFKALDDQLKKIVALYGKTRKLKLAEVRGGLPDGWDTKFKELGVSDKTLENMLSSLSTDVKTFENLENLINRREWQIRSKMSEMAVTALEDALPNKRVMSLRVRLRNPMIFDAKGATPADFSLSDKIDEAKAKGHDGVIFRNLVDPILSADHYVAFSPEQVKSAESATRDDKGNVIPLSQRFNPESPSILYQGGEGFKGMYLSDRALMVYFQNADASTFLHEWFHHLTVNRLLPASYEQALARSFGTPPEKEKGYIWSTQAHEDAANALLVYIRDGSIPENAPASLDEAFQYIKGVLQETQPTINAYQSREALNTEGVNTLFANLVAETTPEQKAVADASMESLRSNPPSEADSEAIAELHEQLGPLAQEVNREQDARYLELAKDPEGNKAELQRMVDDRLTEVGAYWHGTASGDLRGGTHGLHVGTKAAATQALEAAIGIPADGRGWDGTREYGKTLLAGRRRIDAGEFGKYRTTGHNLDAPLDDYYPSQHPEGLPRHSNGEQMRLEYRPWVRPVLIVGEMTNTPRTPRTDERANTLMRRQLRKGDASKGSFYKNEGEDSGSISAVLPNGDAVRVKVPDAVTYDEKGQPIPLSARFNPESPSILFQEVNEESKKAMRNFRSSLSNSARAMVAKMGGGNVKSLYDMGLDDKGEFNNDLFQYKLNLVKKNLAAQHRAVKPIRRALLKESEIAKEAANLTKTIKGDMDSAPDSVEEQAYQAGDGPRSWYWWMAQAKKPFRMLSKYFSTLETFAHFFSFSKQDSALYKLFWKDAEMDGRVIDEMNVERSMRDLKNLHILNGNDEVTLNGRKFRLTQAFDLYVAADGKRITESTDAFKKRVEKNMVKGWEQEDGESQKHYDERVNRDKKIYAILESNDMGDFRITGVEEFNDAVAFIGADKGLVNAMKYAQAEMGKMFDWVNDQIVGVYGEKSRLYKLPGMYSAQFREDGMGDPVEAVLDTLGMSNQAFIKGAQLPSSLKTRTNKAGGAPISLDFFGKYDRYMASMTNAGVRLPTVVKQLRVWSDQDLRKTVAKKFGYTKGTSGGFHVPLWDRMGEAIVGSMRLSGRTMPPSEADNWLRDNVRLPTSMATLGFKPWIALSQFLSTVSAMGEFDAKHIFRAMGIAKDAVKYVGAQRWQANKDAMAAYRAGEKIPINDLPLKGMPLFEEMSKKIPSLRRMLGEWELIEAQMKMPNALDNFARKHGFGHNFMDVAFKEMKIADQINKLIIGATAYEQELEHQKAQGKSLAVAEAAAVDFAESLIRQHVPMASNILRTAFHNAPEAVRMLAPFSSQPIAYFNTVQRNFVLPFVQAYKLAEGNQMDKLGAAFGEVGTKRNMQRAFYLFALPAILWNTLQRRRPPDKEEALWDVIMYPFSMIPIVGDVAAQARLQAQGVRPGEARIPGMIQWYDAYRMRDAITSIYKAAKGEDVNWEATWKNAVALPSDLTGLPKLLTTSPADIVKVDRMSKTDGEFAKNVISQFIFGGTSAKKSED